MRGGGGFGARKARTEKLKPRPSLAQLTAFSINVLVEQYLSMNK